MKIAVFTDSYHPQKNGVVTFLSDFLPELSKHAEVVLFAPGEKELKVEKHCGIKTYWVPALPFPFYEGYRMSTIRRKRITELLVAEKPDVVHLHAPVLLGLRALLVCKKMGLPVVATYHTHFPDYVSHLSKGLLRGQLAEAAKFPVKRLVSTVYSQADVVTAPTVALRDELMGYGIKNAVWVPNGISFSKFSSMKRGARKKYEIPERAPLILYVGRISFEKKIELLLDAFKLVSSQAPDAYLVVAGSGPYLKDYQKLAQAMGLKNAVFTGFVPDGMLPQLYKAADVFASASDSETFGLTFVEAMHFGLPVVGVRKLGAADVIKKGTGFLAEPDNEKDLAAKINRLLGDKLLRKRFGKNGRKEAEKYEMEKIVREFLAIYRSTIFK